jgi:hypothetical protein
VVGSPTVVRWKAALWGSDRQVLTPILDVDTITIRSRNVLIENGSSPLDLPALELLLAGSTTGWCARTDMREGGGIGERVEGDREKREMLLWHRERGAARWVD